MKRIKIDEKCDNLFNFKTKIPVDLKQKYQQGKAEGLKVVCFDGDISCGITVPMMNCKFMRERILAKLRDPGYTGGDEIELDYRRFEKKTMKYLIDALYECNAEPIPIPELLKLVQVVSKMGFTETVQGKQEYPCTAQMLIGLLDCLEGNLSSISAKERIDIGFCLSHHEDEMIQEVMNKCFRGISNDKVRSRAFGYLYDEDDSTFVHNVVKLALRDSGMDGTDNEVRSQIADRAKKLSQQIENDRKKKFLDSPDILRDVSLKYLTTEMGGKIYVDVGGDVGMTGSMLTPPSSATHVLFGAGLKGKNTLKLAVVVKKEDIFDQTDFPPMRLFEDFKAKKVRNFYVYYSTRFQMIGFCVDENIRFGDLLESCSMALDNHSLCIMTDWVNGNVMRCGKKNIVNTSDLRDKYRSVFVYF